MGGKLGCGTKIKGYFLVLTGIQHINMYVKDEEEMIMIFQNTDIHLN